MSTQLPAQQVVRPAQLPPAPHAATHCPPTHCEPAGQALPPQEPGSSTHFPSTQIRPCAQVRFAHEPAGLEPGQPAKAASAVRSASVVASLRSIAAIMIT